MRTLVSVVGRAPDLVCTWGGGRGTGKWCRVGQVRRKEDFSMNSVYFFIYCVCELLSVFVPKVFSSEFPDMSIEIKEILLFAL